MNKMLKTIFVAGLCLVLIGSISLFGCKKEAAPAEEAVEAPAEEAPAEEEAVAAEVVAGGESVFIPGLKAMPDIHIIFFSGGDPGDAYGGTVYKGAVDAQAILGCKVDYVFSGWDSEKMTKQFREAVALKPDAICMMGHAGPEALTPIAEEANAAGIYVQWLNVDNPEARAKFGGSFIGPNMLAQGEAVAAKVAEFASLKAGDAVIVVSDWKNPTRAIREQVSVDYLEAKGFKVIKVNVTGEMGTNPELLIPELSGAYLANPDVKAIIQPGNQALGATPMYFDAMNLQPGDITVGGFGLDPTVLEVIKSGYVQVTAGQHGYMEGFLGIISAAMYLLYGYGTITYDNSAALITKDNYMDVEKTVNAGVGF